MTNGIAPRRSDGAWNVFLVFLRLGLTSFGGPTAHLSYFQTEFVERRRWLSENEYTELIAYTQFLPGPGSSQVGFAIGKVRAGYLGALAAWIGFTLPSAALMMAFAFGAPVLSGGLWSGALKGLTAVAVAVVAYAVWSMARTLTPDARRIVIACGAAVLALTLPGVFGQLGAILFGALAGWVVCKDSPENKQSPSHQEFTVSRRVASACLGLLAALLLALPALAALTENRLVDVSDAFIRAGSVVFGGGHVLLPLLAAEPAVSENISPEGILAGYSAAQAVPGPLFTFAGYLGASMYDGWFAVIAGAAATVAVFLPGMLLLLGVAPFWNMLRRHSRARRALAGVNAGVVGLLAAALIHPVFTSGITSPTFFGLACVAFVLLAAKTPPWAVVALGAIAGMLLGLLA